LRRAFFLGADAFFPVVVALLFAVLFAGAFFFASFFLASLFFFGAAFFDLARFLLGFFLVAIGAVYHRAVMHGMGRTNPSVPFEWSGISRFSGGRLEGQSQNRRTRVSDPHRHGLADQVLHRSFGDFRRFGNYLISVQGCAWFKAYFATAFSSKSKPRPGV